MAYVEGHDHSAAFLATKAENRAWEDAMRVIARDVPDPATYAKLLSLPIAEILTGARSRLGSYYVSRQDAVTLRPAGLTECGEGKRCLTAFGIQVRKALLEMDA